MSLIEAVRQYERAEGKPMATNDALAEVAPALLPMLRLGEPVDESALSWPASKEAVAGALAEDASEDAIAEALLPVYQEHAVHMAKTTEKPCYFAPYRNRPETTRGLPALAAEFGTIPPASAVPSAALSSCSSSRRSGAS